MANGEEAWTPDPEPWDVPQAPPGIARFPEPAPSGGVGYLEPQTLKGEFPAEPSGPPAGSGIGGGGGAPPAVEMGGAGGAPPAEDMPGAGMGYGGGAPGVVPELSPEQAVEHRVNVLSGPQGVERLQQMRKQGVPEEVIRRSIGMAPPPVPGPAQPGAVGVGMGMRAPAAPKVPEYLRRDYPTMYPADYAEKVSAAAVAGEISNDQAKRMIDDFEKWKVSPYGVRARGWQEQEAAAEQAAEFERQRLEIEQKEAEGRQELLREHRARTEADALEQKAQAYDYDNAYKDLVAKHEQAIEEVRAFRVDPSAGRSAFDPIAAALGFVAAGLMKNPAFSQQILGIINKRVDDNIRAQEVQLKTLGSVAQMRANRIGMLRSKLGDDQAARDAERRLQLEAVQAALRQHAGQSGLENIKVDAEQLASNLDIGLQQARTQQDMALAQEAQAVAQQQAMMRAAAAQQMVRARQLQQQQAEMQRTGLGPWQTGKAVGEMRKRYVKGYGFAATPKLASELNERVSSVGQIKSTIGEMVTIMQSPGYATDLQKQARVKSLKKGATVLIKRAETLGALDKGMVEFSDEMIPDALIVQGGAVAGAEQTITNFEANLAARMRQEEMVPGKFGMTMDPKKGVPVEGFRYGIPGAAPQKPAPPIPEMPVQ